MNHEGWVESVLLDNASKGGTTPEGAAAVGTNKG
jgi:hypothetical protein